MAKEFKIYKCDKGTRKGREISRAQTEENAKIQILRLSRLHPQFDFIYREVEAEPKPYIPKAFIGMPDWKRSY